MTAYRKNSNGRVSAKLDVTGLRSAWAGRFRTLPAALHSGPRTARLRGWLDYHQDAVDDLRTVRMTLVLQVCARARRSLDPRFDGKLYIGALGSRVYGPPVVPSLPGKDT